jgi:LDH2 family malate/lactate/ureidoglycolate dehydrogenase
MAKREIDVGVDEVRRVVTAVFRSTGLPADEAAVLVDTLTDAEFRGVRSHGLSRVKLYRQKIVAGSVAMPTRLATLADHQGTARLDGGDGLGQVIAHRAMSMAIDKASRFGIGAVAVRNSQHLGTAGYYANMAAERDMIGLALTNASPRLAPWGGAAGLLGNNPFAVGIPTDDPELPFNLDISNGVASAGRIRQAQLRGEPLPDNWALDKDGKPTTDPQAALDGFLLPFGQHKGYGITLAVSMLTALLAGGGLDAQVRTMDDPTARQHVSHTFIAMNIAAFQPLAEFKSRMSELIGQLHGSPPLPGYERVYYPGERGFLQKRAVVRNGRVPVDASVWEGILALPA